MSLLSQKNETSSFCQNHCYLIGSNAHWVIKIIPLDHYYANIDGTTSKLDYWKKNWVFDRLFCWCQKMRTKLWLCPFFKFSALEHFCGLKFLSWVDILVVLIWYSFQSVRVDLGGELENWTKYSKITEYLKSMSPNFDSPYLWENSSPPLCVIHIQKRLDLLFHPVFPEFVLCCKNHTQIAL